MKLAKGKPAMMKRSRVTCTVVAHEHGFSLQLAPGTPVDLRQPVGPGVTLADCVDPAWFDDEPSVETAAAPQGEA